MIGYLGVVKHSLRGRGMCRKEIDIGKVISVKKKPRVCTLLNPDKTHLIVIEYYNHFSATNSIIKLRYSEDEIDEEIKQIFWKQNKLKDYLSRLEQEILK